MIPAGQPTSVAPITAILQGVEAEQRLREAEAFTRRAFASHIRATLSPTSAADLNPPAAIDLLATMANCELAVMALNDNSVILACLGISAEGTDARSVLDAWASKVEATPQ